MKTHLKQHHYKILDTLSAIFFNLPIPNRDNSTYLSCQKLSEANQSTYCIYVGAQPYFAFEDLYGFNGLECQLQHLKRTMYSRMFDSLVGLSVYHGCSNPYGAIATQEGIQICWTDPHPQTISTRTLFVSSITFTWDDSVSILRALAGAMLKSYRSMIKDRERIPSQFLSHKPRYTDHFSTFHRTWKYLSCQKFLPTMPPKARVKRKGVFLLRYLTPDYNAQTYHVCSSRGEMCVMKTPLRDNWKGTDDNDDDGDKDRLFRREIKGWKEINNIDIYQVTLDGLPFLIMPYLEQITYEEKHALLKSSELEQLLQACFDTGWYFHYISWHNIGWYYPPNNGPRRLMLFSFGHLRSVDSFVEVFLEKQTPYQPESLWEKTPCSDPEDDDDQTEPRYQDEEEVLTTQHNSFREMLFAYLLKAHTFLQIYHIYE